MKYISLLILGLTVTGCQNQMKPLKSTSLISQWEKVKMENGLQVSTKDEILKISETGGIEKWGYNGIKCGPVELSSYSATLTQVKFKVNVKKGYVMFFLSAHGSNAIFRSTLGGESSYITSNEESTKFKPMASTSYPGFGNEGDVWNTMSILYVPSEKKTYSFINEKPLSIYNKERPKTYFWQAVSAPAKGNDFVLKTKDFSTTKINARRASSYIDLFTKKNSNVKFGSK